jgi:hypothetical protein
MEPHGHAPMTERFEFSVGTLVTRPGVSLYSTTPQQIRDRAADIVAIDTRSARAIVDDWQLITLHRHDTDQSAVFLVGQVQGTYKTRVTSPVAQIDLANSLVVTQNSLYALGEKGDGEPSLPQLMAIVCVFERWGIANALGMPQISFGDSK